MAINIYSQSGHVAYKVVHFVIDSDADVANLSTDKSEVAPGSSALATASGNQYILDNNYKWVLYQSGGSQPGPSPDPENTYIWDGGEVI